jgi:hypothetical protein
LLQSVSTHDRLAFAGLWLVGSVDHRLEGKLACSSEYTRRLESSNSVGTDLELRKNAKNFERDIVDSDFHGFRRFVRGAILKVNFPTA